MAQYTMFQKTYNYNGGDDSGFDEDKLDNLEGTV